MQDAIDEVNAKIENIPSVDAYTKEESDQKYATKTALEEVANAVEGKVGKVSAPSYNLFNGEFLTTDGYTTGVTFRTQSGYKTTKPIYLEVGTYYYNLITLSYGVVADKFSKTNQEGTTFESMTATLTGETITMGDKTGDIYAFTVSEAGYYLFNANTQSYAPYFMIVNQSSGVPTHYVPYQTVKKVENDVLLSEDMIEQIRSLSDVDTLFKKNISADGDSICYGEDYRGGFAKIIADNNEMTYENLAVGGATITAETYNSGGGARHWVCRSMQNISTNANYIIIEAGVNDSALGVTLGSITNDYTSALDDTTFYGALETIFKTLTTKYVGKKYGFIIPHRMTAGMYPNGNYSNAIYECAAKWGISVLDLTKSVPPFNSFRSTEEYDTIRNAYTKDGDGWHPTKKCYDQYYVPQIEAWLKTL